MVFEDFLVQQAIVTRADLVAAMDRRAARRNPLGNLAVDQEVLTIQQVFEVLSAQLVSRRRFGEQAVEMGLLSELEIEWLEQLRDCSTPSLDDVLVEMNATTRAALDDARARFARRPVAV